MAQHLSIRTQRVGGWAPGWTRSDLTITRDLQQLSALLSQLYRQHQHFLISTQLSALNWNILSSVGGTQYPGWSVVVCRYEYLTRVTWGLIRYQYLQTRDALYYAQYIIWYSSHYTLSHELVMLPPPCHEGVSLHHQQHECFSDTSKPATLH